MTPVEPIRRLPVSGTWIYVDRLDVAPGTSVAAHVSAPSDHEIEVVKLGLDAVLDPAQPLDADCADATVLETVSCEGAARTITPGSYVRLGGPPVPDGPLSFGLWVRPWRLPVLDVAQVAWHALVADIDYPDAARFGLVVDHLGRPGVYAGDGGAFRHAWLHMAPPVMAARLGRWSHLAASIGPDAVRLFLDGRQILAVDANIPTPIVGPAARLRLGAMAEAGEADDFLDGDIAAPFIAGTLLDLRGARRLFDDGGRSTPADLGIEGVLGYWPLDEEVGESVRDASASGRDGTIVNHGTWMIGGPLFDPADRLPFEYDPAQDRDRGHGLRLSSDDLIDAGWPVSASFKIPADADSGLYAIRVRLAGQKPEEACVAPFVVARRTPRRPGSIALLAATNTWHAYGRRPTNELAAYGLTSSFYSTHFNGRPFFHIGLRLPIPYAQPYAFESRRSTRTRSTHLVRTERHMEAWLHREGYPYEVITDLDLHEDPELLTRFAALVIVGHSEYWTDNARQGVVDYLDGGGRVLSLSGDTLSVRVTIDKARQVMECRKIVYDEDTRWLTPAMWGESWHSHDRQPGGTLRRLGKPAWEVLGISFKGMIDDGTPTSFAAYKLLQPDHFLVRGPHPVVPDADGMIGKRSLNGLSGASGYEFDANPDRTRLGPGPLPGVTTLASASAQRNIEWLGERDHGADLIYWERPDGGVVVNFGSIAAAGALPVDEAFANIVRNTLAHFGVSRAHGESG